MDDIVVMLIYVSLRRRICLMIIYSWYADI